ncbi:uncharacterized protein LOC119191721 [Manduca sexta]|uniref:uncharacterized protein LOC119191721 n=1 Tax=Manduca sexta TaxID=7130 RepID=UPI00188E2F0C|nr:uncharacterized protein LOC119191721 [Manduca sexta]
MDLLNLKKKTTNKKTLTRLPTPVPAGEAEIEGRKPDDVGIAKGEKPNEVVADFIRPLEMVVDSESSESVSSVRSKRFWKRTTRSKGSLCSLFTSDTDEPAPKSQAIDGRGRGGPPAANNYSGLRRAQKERDMQKREEARLKAEKELAVQFGSVKSPATNKAVKTSELDVVLRDDIRKCGEIVRSVLKKPGHSKGASQQALNHVMDVIAQYVSQPENSIVSRLENEVKKWRENSACLEATIKQMQDENSSLRRRLEDLEASTSKQSTEEIMELVEARVQARLESALMGPAQRPLLAHERRLTPGDIPLPVQKKGGGKGKRVTKSAPSAPALALSDVTAGPSSAQPQPVAGPSKAMAITSVVASKKGKMQGADDLQHPHKGRKNGVTPKEQPASQPRLLPSAPVSMDTEWTVVVGKRKKKPSTATAPATAPRQKKTEPRIRLPKSAAVVISLTSTAVEKGLTYAGVLTEAQQKVSLNGLQIDRLRPKFAATGAMIYEVPGAESEQRADSLAARLRGVFQWVEDVRVTRPTKCTELRLSELDPAATPATVAASLSSAGECTLEAVKVGQIRPDRSGLGSVWVKVPVRAAQKIKAGRLRIGWTVARVTVLEARPMRCYRCLEHGHVQNACDGPTDRSDLCYRCGKPGHKARQCEEKPNCVLCAAAGKPAGHQVGGKKCAASSQKTRRRPRRRSAAAGSTAQPRLEIPPQGEAEMEVAEEIAQ